MARAVLTIEADTSSVVRAMGDLRGVARASQAAMTAEARRGAKDREKAARDEERARRRAEGDALRAKRAAERAATSAANRESRERIAAANREARASSDAARRAMLTARSAEREKTRTVEREERQRTRATEREERQRTRATEREERQRTALRLREARQASQASRERSRAGRDIGIGLRRGLNVGGDAALNVGRVAYSEIRDARRQRAEMDNTLNNAFYQAHVGGAEATAMRERLQREVATGSLRGLSMEDVAGGLAAAQTQFNVLAGASPQERARGMDRQIGLMAFARNTYQDPGEVLRVAGMLQQQGITGTDQMETIRAMTGMAQAGSIELSTITSTALGPLMANVARATSGARTQQERAAAVRSSVLETMAVGEITSAGGLNPRNAINALAALRSEVESPMMAQRLRQRLVNDGRTGLADRLTQQDESGRVTLRNRSAVGFVSELMQGMGGDTNAVVNLLRSGGSRNAMVVGSPIRTLIGALASQGQGGRTVAENVARMQREGSAFGAADVERGRQMRDAEQLTAIRSAEEQRLRALNDGTSSVVGFSRALDDFVSRNPIGAAAAQSGAGLLGGVLGGAIFPRLGAAIAGTRAGQAVLGLTGRAAALPGQIAGGAAGAGRAALGAAGALYAGLSFGGATSGTDFEENQRRAAATAEWVRSQGGGMSAGNTTAARTPPTADEIGRAVATALQSSPLQASVDPHTAAHARSATQATPR